jgi:hypothetical protein
LLTARNSGTRISRFREIGAKEVEALAALERQRKRIKRLSELAAR